MCEFILSKFVFWFFYSSCTKTAAISVFEKHWHAPVWSFRELLLNFFSAFAEFVQLKMIRKVQLKTQRLIKPVTLFPTQGWRAEC